MNIEDFLSHLDSVRRTSRGFVAICPAHADRHPSLSISEGVDRRILIHCFAGCIAEDICSAIGLRIVDLFTGNDVHTSQERVSSTAHVRPVDWRQVASSLENHAIGLWLRGQAVLEAAKGLDLSDWTEDERAIALDAVAAAYRDLDRVHLLEGAAFRVRQQGLGEEEKRYASRRRAA